MMIDASDEDFNTNMRKSSEIAKLAHSRGVAVEAELGYIPKLGQPDRNKAGLTSPGRAASFVEATDVDLLVVAIGTAHGFYDRPPKLD